MYIQPLTLLRKVHATKFKWANNLSLHVSLKVYKDGWQVFVRVVGYTAGRDTLEEFCGRKLAC